MPPLFVFVAVILVLTNAQSSEKKINNKGYNYLHYVEQNDDLLKSTNIFNSCIIVSYNYLIQEDTQIENELNKIMMSYEEIQDFEQKIAQQYVASKRIKLDAVKQCVNKQTVDGSQKILSELQNKIFDAKNYYHLMSGFDLKKYFDRQVEYKFTQDDETLSDMIEEFLTKLKKAQGVEEFGFNDLYPQMKDDQLKTKIFGVALESSWLSYMIFFSVAFVIILIMKFAYTTLQDSQKTNSKKQKKQKK
ncbi:unnamed protein product (macronuclear) [Paramecium tetraurelia]|uniref:Transmembrane protein n=1 Tax=Paramecium tetraurelia TaxID=5888 RepID=A0D530_PARTE|nr:uncharacterized protein GSPATT00013594001 [Paramecium tetraurelia]CAK78147.1 unnamed protein product [Paramecium tetraurelia]|eukprot:XP_001445544.1 hypothetical protein (macronuclear) [Paramecium tetraurelia strain d4-2]